MCRARKNRRGRAQVSPINEHGLTSGTKYRILFPSAIPLKRPSPWRKKSLIHFQIPRVRPRRKLFLAPVRLRSINGTIMPQPDSWIRASLFEKLGNFRNQASALFYLGWMAKDRGNAEQAVEMLGRGLKLFGRMSDKQGIACTLSLLGLASIFRGHASATHLSSRRASTSEKQAAAYALQIESCTAKRAAGSCGRNRGTRTSDS